MFRDRVQAALLLAKRLKKYYKKKGVVVFGVPRGGIVLAKIITQKLKLPLGIVVTRKIGAPGQEELAVGAVGPQDVVFLDKEMITKLGVEEEYITRKIGEKKREIEEREKRYWGKQKPLPVDGKTAILVDDGIATGATIKTAIKYLKNEGAEKIVLATPIAPQDIVKELEEQVDEVVVLKAPADFYAVGQFYQDFPQVTDEEVVELLKR